MSARVVQEVRANSRATGDLLKFLLHLAELADDDGRVSIYDDELDETINLRFTPSGLKPAKPRSDA